MVGDSNLLPDNPKFVPWKEILGKKILCLLSLAVFWSLSYLLTWECLLMVFKNWIWNVQLGRAKLLKSKQS